MSTTDNNCRVITVGYSGAKSNLKGDIRIFHLDDVDPTTPSAARLTLSNQGESSSKLRCCSFIKDEQLAPSRHMAVGDFAGNLSIWDIDRLDVPIRSTTMSTTATTTTTTSGGNIQSHNSTVNAIDCYQSLIATGGRDGYIAIWDSRGPLKTSTHSFSHQVDEKKDCWSLLIHGTNVLGGYENGDLDIFDLRTNKRLSSINMKSSVTSISLNNRFDYGSIIVGGNESTMTTMSWSNQLFTQVHEQKGLSKFIWSARYSPFKSNVYCTSDSDGNVSLYDDKVLVDRIKICDFPVLHLDYNQHKEGLMAAISLNRKLSIIISPYGQSL
ncbi:hypothetical protein SAMD00019534_007110 [Acytostelium subglobosum LB1]|uniref:hypothetical protein n=1 Tax=Acytostelium subglobosum LB1 TaxID=1410327 RepID=UPI0006449ACE|nr:hypothetical protein SAMD00019534_007110 [Acytostelium subglobosum LB1]GAM17536.1 hypothetical protein SAMD00019534_007110 [Acytostelium subglobosum LB1]|eukprot:XP_012759598.1 hypothetical protein SAMD00019534_007110 [Acytostelium subglobosum LB1]